MSVYETSTQQLWSKAIAQVNAGTANQLTSGGLVGSAENALPSASLEKLERFRSEKRAAYVAYIDCSDREQEARLELLRQEGFARRTSEQFQGASISFEGQPHPGSESKDDRNTRINAPVDRARRTLQIACDARERASKRQEEFSFLETVEDWLARTPLDVNVDLVTFDPSRLKGNPAVAVAKIRSELASLDERLSVVELANAPADVLKQQAFAEIDAIAEEGHISVNARSRGGRPLRLSDKIRIDLTPHGTGFALFGNAGAHFFTWLLRDELKSKIGVMIDDLKISDALSDDEREAEFRKIAGERLDLEYLEEAVITQAEANGQTIPRRHDVDPRAFLGIDA